MRSRLRGDDGPFGGDVEIYYRTWDVLQPSTVVESGIRQIPGNSVISLVNLQIFPQPASQFLTLGAQMWESDGFLSGDDYKGEALPNITGSMDIASWDPQAQVFWGAYQVAVNQ